MILPEHLEAGAGSDRLAHHRLGPGAVGLAGEHHHPRRQADRQILEVARAAALERLDRFDHLERVADRRGRAARPSSSGTPRCGRRTGCPTATSDSASARAVSAVFMNAPRPALTSSTSASIPSAIFLLMIDAVMSGMLSTVAGDVAQRVERLVGRRDLGGLADHAAADLGQHPLELAEQQADAEAGDRFELVEGAAGVAEAPARHHRHDDAAGGGERREDQRGLVADAAGAVLVDLQPGQVRQVDLDARVRPSPRSGRRSPRRSSRAGRSPSAGRRSGSRARCRP